jgi:hypothetical protein
VKKRLNKAASYTPASAHMQVAQLPHLHFADRTSITSDTNRQQISTLEGTSYSYPAYTQYPGVQVGSQQSPLFAQDQNYAGISPSLDFDSMNVNMMGGPYEIASFFDLDSFVNGGMDFNWNF